MPLTKSFYTVAAILALPFTAQAAFFYPTVQASLIEHILVDAHGAHSSGFVDAITPCTNYVSGPQTAGRETAAEWLRTAFHDFVTAHVSQGTGGIDASIGFETLRTEDAGVAFNDSLAFFRPYVTSKVSMADLIALSVSLLVENCGGPQIPVRGGRIDATAAGPFGVPAPDTDLSTTLGYFKNSGFNQADAIGLTACGHTMGTVHHDTFPTVVGPEAVAANNTSGAERLDSTVATYDSLVVTEYLTGTGQQGGPLVTSFNVSSRNDLRLYESDNNATMEGLAVAGKFVSTCSTLLQRMVETVPHNVQLSSVISPAQIKPINATLDFGSSGNVVFSGYIRILTSPSASPPTSLTILISGSLTTTTLTPEAATGTSVFGTTTFFPFSIPVATPILFGSFTVTGAGLLQIFSVESSAFVVPSMTTRTGGTVDFIVAENSSNSPQVTVQAPVAQAGTLGPAISTFSKVAVEKVGTKAGYTLWSGTVNAGSSVTGPVSVAVVNGGGNDVDILFV